MDDLVKRLLRTKTVADYYGNAGTTLVNPDGKEAVARIEELERDLDRLATLLKEAEEALEWYAEKAAGCRKITREGDEARQALDRDGGGRARTTLAHIAAEREAQP